jgi:hypothetical protein
MDLMCPIFCFCCIVRIRSKKSVLCVLVVMLKLTADRRAIDQQ